MNLAALTDDQPELAARRIHERPSPKVGDVHVLFGSLAPGQAEIRFTGMPGTSHAEVLRAAIRELQAAVTAFGE